MLVGDIAKLHAANSPGRAALVDEAGVRLTWRQFYERTNRLANAMIGLGLAKGDRVAIFSANRIQFAEFLFAAAKAGLVSVGLNYRATPQQIVAVMGDAEPAAIFIAPESSREMSAALSGLGSVTHFIGIGGNHDWPLDYDTLLARASSSEPAANVTEDDLCSLPYTSGTSGEPKGVPFTHRRWLSGLWTNAFMRLRLKPDDVFLLGFPMCMISGQFHLLSAALAGATSVVHTFSGRGFAELVERERPTITYLGGTQYGIVREHLDGCGHAYDLRSLRSIHVGARPMPTPQMKEMLDYFQIPYHATHREYGSTESVPHGVSVLTGEDIARGLGPNATEQEKKRLDSVGRPFLVEVRVVDDRDNDVPAGHVGEIVCRGEFSRTGYWRKPALTRERYVNGWFHTGDIASYDEDGYLYLKGRKDFMIKSGQIFVAPFEVETAIMRHPSVQDAAVVGVPDSKWGEAVTAVVCLKKGCTSTVEEIKEHCRKRLAAYQVPKSVRFVSVLPKDSQGKTQIRELRQLLSLTSTSDAAQRVRSDDS